MQSKRADCEIKKSKFVREQEVKGLLSSLAFKTWLSKIPLFGDIFFWVYKMNEIMNKFLMVGHIFIPEMHLKQPSVTHSACGPFTRNNERIGKFMQTENADVIAEMSLIKLVFNMIRLMANQKTYQKELNQMNFKR